MTGNTEISWRRTGRTAPDELDFRRRPGAGRNLPAGEAERIARGVPQAVLRILSYRRGRSGVARTAAYIAAKAGETLTIEGEGRLEGAAERCALVAEWADDFSARARGRDAVHLELSAPPGSDRVRLAAAARAFAETEFGPHRRYLLAEHRDTPHPHVHLLVKLRGYDGRQLDPRKADLARWREAFAAAARVQGLELGSSPRAARAPSPRLPLSQINAARQSRRAGPGIATVGGVDRGDEAAISR